MDYNAKYFCNIFCPEEVGLIRHITLQWFFLNLLNPLLIFWGDFGFFFSISTLKYINGHYTHTYTHTHIHTAHLLFLNMAKHTSSYRHLCKFHRPHSASTPRNMSTWLCACAAHTLDCTSDDCYNNLQFHKFYCLCWVEALQGRNRQFLFQEQQNSGCYSLRCSENIRL